MEKIVRLNTVYLFCILMFLFWNKLLLYKFFDVDLHQLISRLKRNIVTDYDIKKTYNSVFFFKGDICQNLLVPDSRFFIFEFFPSYASMKRSAWSDNYRLFTSKIKDNLTYISKKNHFACFSYKEEMGVKAYADILDTRYLHIPIENFCKEILNKSSSLGLDRYQFMEYFNYLDMFYETSEESKCYVFNIQKEKKINVFTFDELRMAVRAIN
ncbi:hypothetical protein [Marinicella sp. W31]|uniref:hypothetical protein n=1 Tax=Marinicella sp. W31 TaxID=3023713 RepID=UPI0037582B94